MRGARHEDTGTTDDKLKAVGMVASLYKNSTTDPTAAANADLAACEERTRALVRDNWAGIHRVAKELYWRRLTADEIKSLLRDGR